METAELEDLVGAPVIAKRLGLNTRKAKDRVEFWRRVHAFGIPHFRLGPRTILFSRAAVETWLKRRAVGAEK